MRKIWARFTASRRDDHYQIFTLFTLTLLVLVGAALELAMNGESSWEEARELVGETVPEEPARESRGERFWKEKSIEMPSYVFTIKFWAKLESIEHLQAAGVCNG